MKKKLRYPEYINGIKQEQNPIKRFMIRVWYADWFRVTFVICPIWLLVCMVIFMWIFPLAVEFIRVATIAVYGMLFIIALIFNDYEQLNKIGLDTDHQPLIEKDL